jgi:hypothetical protein
MMELKGERKDKCDSNSLAEARYYCTHCMGERWSFDRSMCNSSLATEGNAIHGNKSDRFMYVVEEACWIFFLIAFVFQRNRKQYYQLRMK